MESEMYDNIDDELEEDLDVWGLIVQKLEERGKTIAWLSEQVPAGKRRFYWYYKRNRIKTDMMGDISDILKHNFFKDCSLFVQKVLAKKRAQQEQENE